MNAAGPDSLAWHDPLSYPRPPLIEVAEPAEQAVAARYWIDLTRGTGTRCTQPEPCGALRDLIGKPGLAGGPAIVYLRGRGRLYLYNDVFHGAPGREVLLRPWDAEEVAVEPGSNGSSLSGAQVHDLIIDGGPDLAIHWINTAGGDNFALHLRADRVTVRRTEGYCTVPDVSGVIAAGDYGRIRGLRLLNNEFHDCGNRPGQQASALYLGPGDGGGYTDVEVANNLIYAMGGEGIEVNPRITSSGLRITGNVIHDVGKQTCFGQWECRPGITLSIQSGEGNNASEISGNAIWDVGADCIWDRGGGQPPAHIAGNDCHDHHRGVGAAVERGMLPRLAHRLGWTRARLGHLARIALGLLAAIGAVAWLARRQRRRDAP